MRFSDINQTIDYWLIHKPKQTALSMPGGEAISYEELHQRSLLAAGWLRQQGLQTGDTLVLIDFNSIDLIAFMCAGFRLGLVVAPINWQYNAETLQYILDDSAAKLVLYGKGVEGFIRDRLGPDFANQSIPMVDLNIAWQAAVEISKALQPADTINRDNISLLIYTSGTTGTPKGVCLSQRNLMAVGNSLAPIVPDGRDGPTSGAASNGAETRYLITAFQFHMAGCGIVFLGLIKGCHTVLMPYFTPDQCHKIIRTAKINYLFLAPVMIQAMLALPAEEEGYFDSLHCIQFGGAPMEKDLLVQAGSRFGCPILQGYGLSETAGLVSFMPASGYDRIIAASPEDPDNQLLQSAGAALSTNEVAIFDELGKQLPPGQTGEIHVRGENIMLGYWKQPAWDSSKWFPTGDLGRLDEEGFIYLSDRKDDMIITRGINIHPAEVENVLTNYPGIRELAIVGMPDNQHGEAVCAVLVPESLTFNINKFLTWASEKMAEYQVPREVRFRDQLPRNAAGKVLRKALRDSL